MTHLTLRKGFVLQPVPGGVGHLTDSRTGDALVVPAADYVVLAGGDEEGLDASRPEVAEVLSRYRPFYVEAAPFESFYELDIEDAPTAVEIPTIAPVVPTIAPVTLSGTELELKAALEAATNDEPETKEHAPFVEAPLPLEPDEEFTQPGGEQPTTSGQYLSQEENLRQAMETQPTEQVSRPEIAALFGEVALADPAEAAPARAPTPAPPLPRSSAKPLLLTLAGLTLLGLGVAATWVLRPEFFSEQPAPFNPTTVVSNTVDASVPVTQPALDAGAAALVSPEPVALVDAGATTPEPVVIAAVDAGSPGAEGNWLTGEVQSRGRVKMGEVVASASGTVTWQVDDAQRVKGKQALGQLTREGGDDLNLTAPSVGLVMIKQPTGGAVKRGAVLAEIIYFEAWAKGLIRGKPSTSWRCEVVSVAANQKADCKISVVSPKSGGALVTVAIEPRWFDDATDAVLRVSPP
jgi:hypothetical protein